MKISNQEIRDVYKWLDIPLHGEELRARSDFLNQTSAQHRAIDEKRLSMLVELADKDEEGKPIIQGGVYKMSPESMKQFSDDYSKFLDETFEYDLKPETKKNMHNILANKLNRGFKIDEAVIHSSLLEKFA